MALIVENGTGLDTAEAYLSVVDLKAYCDKWGYDYSTQTDATLEQKLRLGAAFIDTMFRFKGGRVNASQALEFPRAGLIDWSNFEVTGVPQRVIKANAELAFKALSEPLYTDLDRGGMVTSESVGPISVSYAEGAPVGKVYRFAENLLKPFVRDPGDMQTGPLFGTSEAAWSGIGMFDNPEVGNGISAEE